MKGCVIMSKKDAVRRQQAKSKYNKDPNHNPYIPCIKTGFNPAMLFKNNLQYGGTREEVIKAIRASGKS